MSRRRKTGGLFLVGSQGELHHQAGEVIPTSGIYRVFHGSHRVFHDVTLICGELFPACEVCEDSVRFELLQPAPTISEDSDFKIKLYRIPHPQNEEEQVALA